MGYCLYHRGDIPMSADPLLLDEMGWYARKHLSGNQRHHCLKRRHIDRLRLLDPGRTSLAALGLEATLEEEGRCGADVLRGNIRYGRQHSASAGSGAFRCSIKRKLGVLRRLSLEFDRDLCWHHVVSSFVPTISL